VRWGHQCFNVTSEANCAENTLLAQLAACHGAFGGDGIEKQLQTPSNITIHHFTNFFMVADKSTMD